MTPDEDHKTTRPSTRPSTQRKEQNVNSPSLLENLPKDLVGSISSFLNTQDKYSLMDYYPRRTAKVIKAQEHRSTLRKAEPFIQGQYLYIPKEYGNKCPLGFSESLQDKRAFCRLDFSRDTTQLVEAAEDMSLPVLEFIMDEKQPIRAKVIKWIQELTESEGWQEGILDINGMYVEQETPYETALVYSCLWVVQPGLFRLIVASLTPRREKTYDYVQYVMGRHGHKFSENTWEFWMDLPDKYTRLWGKDEALLKIMETKGHRLKPQYWKSWINHTFSDPELADHAVKKNMVEKGHKYTKRLWEMWLQYDWDDGMMRYEGLSEFMTGGNQTQIPDWWWYLNIF